MCSAVGRPAEMPASGASSSARWLCWAGAAFIVFGGLVAAVTGPLEWSKGSWAAAYLVLVCGVAQYGLGQALRLRALPLTGRGESRLFVGWNAGNLAVLVGTLAAAPYVVDVGGAVLVAVLLGLLWAMLHHRGTEDRSAHASWARWALITLLVILIVSVPVGLVLSHLRS